MLFIAYLFCQCGKCMHTSQEGILSVHQQSFVVGCLAAFEKIIKDFSNKKESARVVRMRFINCEY